MAGTLVADAIEDDLHVSPMRAAVVAEALPVCRLHRYVGDAVAAVTVEVSVRRGVSIENQRIGANAQCLYYSCVFEKAQSVVHSGARNHRHIAVQLLVYLVGRGMVAVLQQVAQHSEALMRGADAEPV